MRPVLCGSTVCNPYTGACESLEAVHRRARAARSVALLAALRATGRWWRSQ